MPATLTRPETQAKTVRLREDVAGGIPRVDREHLTIRNVKILGRESRNGRIYEDSAMDDATRLYSGMKVSLNHRKRGETGDRDVRDLFGQLENVQRRGDGVYGDLLYVGTHPSAPQILEIAERRPNMFGLSHDSEGKVTRKNGKNTVESVDRVHSVDLVANPATNRGLFESADPAQIGNDLEAAIMDIVRDTSLTSAQRAAKIKAVIEANDAREEAEDKLNAVLGVTDDEPIPEDPPMASDEIAKTQESFIGRISTRPRFTPLKVATPAQRKATARARLNESLGRTTTPGTPSTGRSFLRSIGARPAQPEQSAGERDQKRFLSSISRGSAGGGMYPTARQQGLIEGKQQRAQAELDRLLHR